MGVTVLPVIIGGTFQLAILGLFFYAVHKIKPLRVTLKAHFWKGSGIETEFVIRESKRPEIEPEPPAENQRNDI